MIPKEGQRVHVYYRIPYGDLSVCNTKRRVIANTDRAVLRDAELRVQPAGRRRTVEDGQRNVHAFVYGYWSEVCPVECPVAVRYNPYEAGHFQTVEGGEAIAKAEWAIVEGSRVYVPTVA